MPAYSLVGAATSGIRTRSVVFSSLPQAPLKVWTHDEKSQLIRKDPYARKSWGQEEKGERLLPNEKTPGFIASQGEEFNPGPEMRLDCSEILSNKVLLKYKGDRESFWHRHQKGAERVPPCLSSTGCYIVTSSLLMKERNVLKFRMAPGPSPIRCIFGIILAPNGLSWAIKWLTWILKKGRPPYK